MKNKLLFTFNSHRTYSNGLSNNFTQLLSNERQIDYQDSEFLMYHIHDFKVIIDSFMHIYISFENSNQSFDYIFHTAKKEYLFLCSLNEKFDANSTIEISASENWSSNMNNHKYNQFEDVLFLTV